VVPTAAVEDVFKIGSEAPSALLYDALAHYKRGSPRAYENVKYGGVCASCRVSCRVMARARVCVCVCGPTHHGRLAPPTPQDDQSGAGGGRRRLH
jgi:hypothetical protein